MNYFVDITPALINKTAIYNIIKDTLLQLPELDKNKLALGKKYSGDNNFNSPAPKLFSLAIKFPRLFVFIRSFLVFILPTENRPILFFDPLYILFYRKLTNSKVFILDLTPVTHPQWHNKKVAFLYKYAFKTIEKSGIVCLSISKSTKLELEKNFKINSDRSKVLYLYSHSNYQPMNPPSKSKNILFVGSFEPRKNLIGLITGFQQSNLAELDYKLHIVGAKTHHFNENELAINKLKGIIIHGYLSDSELLKLYSDTRIFAYPSFWEGFGVPLLEAINLKIAAFASNQSACPEIGGPNMKYVNPYDTAAISKMLIELSNLNDSEYLKYTEEIYTHAKQFNLKNYINNLKNELEK